MKTPRLDPKLTAWIEARKRYRLSHAHVQMAQELGLNPRKLGSLANRDQEPWKAALPAFIERIYRKSFGRDRPESELSIEERALARAAKKAAQREARQRAREQRPDEASTAQHAEGSSCTRSGVDDADWRDG